MSRESATGPGSTEDPPGGGEPPEIDEGRYVYCVVRTDGGDDGAIETDGVDDEPVSIVAADGVAAVVHACEGLYDSSDLAQVRRWLVRHQTVVDEAGEAFGTPLPFQFDTIVRGDDEAVREWLARERERLRAALDSLAGHWEYRIEVRRTDPIDDADLEADDDDLAALRERIGAADEGAAFMLEKRYERRASRLRERRDASLTDEVCERLADHAREVHELDPSPAADLGVEPADAGSDDDAETICRLTLLAHEDAEGAIGSVLDDVADRPGLEVRFTGPWPPYTFAPSFGEGDDAGTGLDTDGTQ